MGFFARAPHNVVIWRYFYSEKTKGKNTKKDNFGLPPNKH